MDETDRPADLHEFLNNRLSALPAAARLVLVLDPDGRLALESELAVGRRKWQVVRYDGNDLAFRKELVIGDPDLVWVTGPPSGTLDKQAQRIDLSSLVDVLRRADDVFDLSLVGVLTALVPGETWPFASVELHASIISSRLDTFIGAYSALRPYLEPEAVLDTHSIRAMALHCLQPDVDPRELLFKLDSPTRVLSHYVTLAWGSDWNETGHDILRQQARQAGHLPFNAESIEPWFEIATDDLARFLYLYRFLSRAHVPNIVNQLRGLGILGLDPEPLEPALGTVLTLWDKDRTWRRRIIRQAESALGISDVQRAVKLIELSSPDEIADAIAVVEAPALIYHLGARLLESASDAKRMSEVMVLWSEHRPASLSGLSEGDTPFARAALAIVSILDEAAFISALVSRPVESAPDLARLLDRYVDGGYSELEFAHARALVALNRLPDETQRESVRTYLDDLRGRMREYLDQLDHELARHIVGNWNAFLGHPRLAINVLRDFVKTARLKPTADACLWFLVLDGMRFDTWRRVVKPRLAERYELKKEKAYLSVLPSWTKISRTALLAAKPPDFWVGHRKTFSFNQGLLAGIFFDVAEKDQDRKVRFYSGMESDRTAAQFDRKKRYPFNVLVFNISDDDLHKQRENVAALNENVESALKRIVDFLDGLIRPDDMVVVSSDHGFMELDPEDAIVIGDDSHWEQFAQGGDNPVRFRYIMGVERPAGLPLEDAYSFEYGQVPQGKFTVAVGRKWFKREGTTQFDRYAHGGLSFSEMVVPGAVMQLITERKIAIHYDDLPEAIAVNEDTTRIVIVGLRNRGNQTGEFELACTADTDTSLQVTRRTLAPGERCEVPVTIVPVVRSGKPLTRSLRLVLKHTAFDGKTKTAKRDIPITVHVRMDKVEIGFGGLEDLDL